MRFLADENVPGPAVATLRARGHDVRWVKEAMPGGAGLASPGAPPQSPARLFERFVAGRKFFRAEVGSSLIT